MPLKRSSRRDPEPGHMLGGFEFIDHQFYRKRKRQKRYNGPADLRTGCPHPGARSGLGQAAVRHNARLLQHCPISRPSASATVGGVRLKPSTGRVRGGRLYRQSLRRPRARAGFPEARAPIDRSHQENNPSTVRISSQKDRRRWVRLAVTGRVIGR